MAVCVIRIKEKSYTIKMEETPLLSLFCIYSATLTYSTLNTHSPLKLKIAAYPVTPILPAVKHDYIQLMYFSKYTLEETRLLPG